MKGGKATFGAAGVFARLLCPAQHQRRREESYLPADEVGMNNAIRAKEVGDALDY